MNTYQIAVRGKQTVTANGNNPTEAFNSIAKGFVLVSVDNPIEADCAISLIGGKRKSQNYYKIVSKTKEQESNDIVYTIQMRGKQGVQAKGKTPELAFDSILHNYSLVAVANAMEADVCISYMYGNKLIQKFYKAIDKKQKELALANLVHNKPKDEFSWDLGTDYEDDSLDVCNFSFGTMSFKYIYGQYDNEVDYCNFVETLVYALEQLIQKGVADWMVENINTVSKFFDFWVHNEDVDRTKFTFVLKENAIYKDDVKLDCSLRNVIYGMWLHKYDIIDCGGGKFLETMEDIFLKLAELLKFELD